MEDKALLAAKEWAENSYFDNESRNEIKALLDSDNKKEIVERFYKDLEFGTGGLRSILGAGTNRINLYTVRKATQAMANVIKKNSADAKMAISYDSRRLSKELAMEAASVIAANGIKAYIFDRLNPVPMLAFSVRYHKANAGIMITASHNPPAYNGFKAYWADGGQVTPPYDSEIIEAYNSITDWNEIKYDTFENGLANGKIEWVGEKVENAYHEMLFSNAINPNMCKEHGGKLKIVYSPLHGTGKVPCSEALSRLGLNNLILVPEQAEPDENFSTVSSPNPEDVEALELAVSLMKKENADVAYGTDPDTDRVGVVVNTDKDLLYLNGNQIAVLLLDYMLGSLKEQNKMPANPLVIKTIVTSELQKTICDHYGVKIEDTLTGFKWIGRRITDIENENLNLDFLFASEESYGYLSHDQVRDKDGVNAIALVSEMALHHKLQGKNLGDALDDIYTKYGFSYESLLSLKYEGKEGAEKIVRIMDNFRNWSSDNICGEKIASIEDYKASVKKNIADDSTSEITLPKSNVIGFTFESGNKLFLRPSGTEPKIKFYIMIQETEGDLETKKNNANHKVSAITELCQAEAEKA